MATIYDRTDIYDLGFDERKKQIIKEHWELILKDTNVKSILDCSIGTGNLTLPLVELGYELSGSDLSLKMLSKCEKKAKEANLSVTLFQSDFREIDQTAPSSYDLVMSTGNSLPYVSNQEVLETLHKMDLIVNEKGYLYFDMRNWDKILKEHQKFYFYNPTMVGDVRVDSSQYWEYDPDGSITFNIVYSFEKDMKVMQREIFEEKYNPIKRELILNELKQMGYSVHVLTNMPIQCPLSVDEFDWYCVLAQKGE